MKISFFTVCGGGDDYEFLLGSIRHHAEMGTHIVLDTTPPYMEKSFKNLPSTVKWIYEPFYGYGWKNFKLATAVERAIDLCRKYFDPDTYVYLDCDEFFSKNSETDLFPKCTSGLYAPITHHWDNRGQIHPIEPLEWHNRIWTRDARIKVARNESWKNHPEYNGNPEHHCIVIQEPGSSTKYQQIPGYFHHHVHYAVGSKNNDGKSWSNGDKLPEDSPWPNLLKKWRNEGILPSTEFS